MTHATTKMTFPVVSHRANCQSNRAGGQDGFNPAAILLVYGGVRKHG